jgi:hypothetical protein
MHSKAKSFNRMPASIHGLKDFESCSSFARDVVSSRPGEPYPPGVVPYDQLPTAACRHGVMPMALEVAGTLSSQQTATNDQLRVGSELMSTER